LGEHSSFNNTKPTFFKDSNEFLSRSFQFSRFGGRQLTSRDRTRDGTIDLHASASKARLGTSSFERSRFSFTVQN
jgi:hypothetical protein